MRKKDPAETREKAATTDLARRIRSACASDLTYDRLKELAFDEAIRIRNADPVNLDLLATHSVLRIEEPVVASRDETLDITVCRGRFILELPPGAERAFEGKRRLEADVEYAAQAAADGSGLVYRMSGAEPIVYSLAAFDLKNAGRADRTVAADRLASAPAAPQSQTTPPAAAVIASDPEPTPVPRRPAAPTPPDPAPEPRPKVPGASQEGPARPSFNCRHARTRSERLICSDGGLASLDRSMSSLYYSTLSGADTATRAELRRSRDRFLAYRERCPTSSCVAQAYRGRMQEIRDIGGR